MLSRGPRWPGKIVRPLSLSLSLSQWSAHYLPYNFHWTARLARWSQVSALDNNSPVYQLTRYCRVYWVTLRWGRGGGWGRWWSMWGVEGGAGAGREGRAGCTGCRSWSWSEGGSPCRTVCICPSCLDWGSWPGPGVWSRAGRGARGPWRRRSAWCWPRPPQLYWAPQAVWSGYDSVGPLCVSSGLSSQCSLGCCSPLTGAARPEKLVPANTRTGLHRLSRRDNWYNISVLSTTTGTANCQPTFINIWARVGCRIWRQKMGETGEIRVIWEIWGRYGGV